MAATEAGDEQPRRSKASVPGLGMPSQRVCVFTGHVRLVHLKLIPDQQSREMRGAALLVALLAAVVGALVLLGENAQLTKYDQLKLQHEAMRKAGETFEYDLENLDSPRLAGKPLQVGNEMLLHVDVCGTRVTECGCDNR